MDGPNGVGVLTSRSRHQMRAGDKSGAARKGGKAREDTFLTWNCRSDHVRGTRHRDLPPPK